MKVRGCGVALLTGDINYSMFYIGRGAMPLPFIGYDGHRRKHDDLPVHLRRIGEEMRRLMTEADSLC